MMFIPSYVLFKINQNKNMKTQIINSGKAMLLMVIIVVASQLQSKAQSATNFAKAYNKGAKQFDYVANTKNSVLVIENTHNTRAIMCTYTIQDKEYGYTDKLKIHTGRTEEIYPGEIVSVYKGPVYKFIYIKKAWFAN